MFVVGMHRKSMEAAHTLSNDILKEHEDEENTRTSMTDENESADRKPKIVDDTKDDFRSNSIAALRAKAQEHSAKLFGVMDSETTHSKMFNPLQNTPNIPNISTMAQQHHYSGLENSQSVF